MNKLIPAVLAALALGLSAVPAVPAVPAPAAAPSLHAPQEVIDRDEFLKKFRRAMEIKANAEMASLFRRHPVTAMTLVIEYGEQIALNTNEDLEVHMQAFIRAWKDAFDTDFALNMYEYFSLMKTQVRAYRGQCIGQFRKVERDYHAAIEAKNFEQLDLACAAFEELAEAFTNAGDYYYVSECWWRAALGSDTGTRGNQADIERAGKAYAKAAEARKRIGLEDTIFSTAKTRSDQLLGQAKQAADSAAGGDEGGGAPGSEFTRHKAGVSLAEEVRHELAFEMVEDIERYYRPGYALQDLSTVWSAISFGKRGTTGSISSFPEGPQGIRLGGGVTMDVERDGRGDVEISMTGNAEPVVLTLGEGDSLRQWGFLARQLSQKEIYHGIEVNLEPQENFLTLYIAPAATMVGEVAGEPFRVFDDNLDGVYGSIPLYWGYVGLVKGSLQPEYDTVLIGKSKRALPWSEYQQIGADWYQVLSDPQKHGTEVVTSKAQLETGRLKVDFDGGKPEYLIVRGTGTFEWSYFDVMSAGKKGLEVPAGVYSLFAGELRKGKRKQVMKALIIPGAKTPTWTVSAGETTTIELGAPFSFDWAVDDKEDAVTVPGASVAVVGRSGERYERLWNCAARPEIQMRKAGTKKSGRTEEMGAVLDQDTLTNEGFASAWFPRDTTIEKKKSGEEVELKLFQKKHKLFGEIESDWKRPND